MDKALVLNDNLDLMTLGDVMVKSGFFQDSHQAAQAVVKILAGQELGFGPIASMTGINVIKGRVTLSANLIAAAIKRTGRYNYRIRKQDNDGCEIEFFEAGQSIGVSAFTRQDATAAGLLAGDNWRKYPRNMYFARAISNGAKWFCPDVFSGPVYTPDEMGAEIDAETGEVIEYPAEPVQPEPEPAPAPAPEVKPANGNNKPANGNGIPNSPQKLLDTVNRRVSVPYDNLLHLNKALKQEIGDGWSWPKPAEAEAWQEALDVATRHARAKEQEGSQDELPLAG